MAEPTNWRVRAACRATDPRVFFPGPSDSHAEARRVCARCPVVDACLRDAVRMQDTYGYRGGKSGDERKGLLRSTRVPVPTADVVRLHGLRWTPGAIAVRLGLTVDVVRRVVRAHASEAAA